MLCSAPVSPRSAGGPWLAIVPSAVAALSLALHLAKASSPRSSREMSSCKIGGRYGPRDRPAWLPRPTLHVCRLRHSPQSPSGDKSPDLKGTRKEGFRRGRRFATL